MNPMERIRQLVEKGYANLSEEERTELQSLVNSEFDRLDGEPNTAVNVELLNELVGTQKDIKSDEAARAEAETQAAAAAEQARKEMRILRGEETPEVTPKVPAEPAAAATDPAAGTAPAEEDDETTEPVAVAASAGVRRFARLADMNRVAAGRSPISPTNRVLRPPRSRLVAAAEVPGFSAGQEMGGESLGERRERLANAMVRRLQGLSKSDSPTGRHLVASIEFEFPDDRKLGADPYRNSEIMDAVTSQRAVVASGGVCSPVNVDYGVPTFSVADQPIRDGNPSFTASRGGLTYVTPPVITNLAGATTIWTEANDADPVAPTTKPVLVVACGQPETVYVNAIPTRLQFGNMQGRFAPEQIAANTDLAFAAAARISENELLALIAASATAFTTQSLLGATRDLLATIDQAAAAYRNRYRIPRSLNLTAILPDWVKDLVRADLTRELAHDNGGSRDSLAITDEQIDGLLAARGVSPIWHLDGQAAQTGGTGTGPAYSNQMFAAQVGGNNHVLVSFPTNVVWYLYVEGTVQILDGGSLDLGVVRDSTLDATNDYETFVEQFLGVAFRGNEVDQLVSTLCPTGASGGTVNTEGYCS